MKRKLYVAAQNDGLYIIDQPPRPSNDDINPDRPVNVFAKVCGNSPLDQALAEEMVRAYNATP